MGSVGGRRTGGIPGWSIVAVLAGAWAAGLAPAAAHATAAPADGTVRCESDDLRRVHCAMETGAGVNFIAGPNGPTYSYWFRPKDALVLMIRKDVR